MKILFLCGGIGKRMYPLEEDKFLHKFIGKELILHHIGYLKEQGLKEEDFVFVGNPSNIEKLRQLCGEDAEYAVQKTPKGMADAVLTAKNLPRGDEILIVNPNDVFEPSAYEKILKKKEGDSVILGYKVDKYFPGGYLIIEDEKIKGIVEKPEEGKEPSNLVNIVVHLHRNSDEFIRYLEKTESEQDDLYERTMDRMIKDGFDFRVVEYDGFWTAIKYPWHIFNVMEYFLNKIDKQVLNDIKIPESAKIEGNVIIEAGAKIFENTVIKGPAYIGKDCVIGNNSLIRESHIGDRCVVGYSTEIKHAYIGDDCWFHTNYIGDSIIGNGCYFGSGAVTANWRFDEKNISIKIEDMKIDTGLDKLGCIMANNCKVGVNSSIMPGVRIGTNSIIGTGTVVIRDLEPNKFLFFKGKQMLKENRMEIKDKKKERMKRIKRG
jgi:NDP-sugar pyrophosphorylase family protein